METEPTTLDEANSLKLPFDPYLGGGFQYVYFHPSLGKIPILTSIFQMGWFNHQLAIA